MSKRSVALGLIGLAAAAALTAYDPAGLDAYTDAKLLSWCLLLSAAFAVWASGDAHRPARARLDAAVLALLASAGAAALFSLDGTLSLFGPPHLRSDGLLPLLSLAGGYAAARLMGLGDGPRPFFMGLAGAALLLGLGAVLEKLGFPPAPGLPTGLTDGRANSVSGSPVYLGVSLAVCFPAVLDLLRSERGRIRLFAAAAAAACVAGLWLSRSRGAWISAAAGAACWAALSPDTLSQRLRKAAFAAAALAMLALPGLFLLRGSHAASDAGRLEVWKASLRLAGERPWTGWGPGTLEMALPLRADAAFVKAYGREQTQASAHNDLLHAFAVCGVPGLLALILLWSVLILSVRSALAAGLPGAAAATAGLAALFLQSKVSPVPFGAAAAAGLYAACLVRSVPRSRVGWGWLPALLFGGFALLGSRAVAADRAHRRGLEAQRAGRFPEMEHSLKEAARLDPSNPGPAYERALLLVKAAQAASPAQKRRFSDSAVTAARALINGRPNAASGWHALGFALAERGGPGDREAAITALDQALSRDWRRLGLIEARETLGPATPVSAAARARMSAVSVD